MKKKDILKVINQKKWFHKYEIIPGIFTPGIFEVHPRQNLDLYGIPVNLSGKKVLDIGAWDGAYTFEFESRGAVVTALDIQDPDRTGFNVSKKIKKSRVEYICASVYDLVPELNNKFDIVFFKGVYYHLKNPLLAFQKIWDVLKHDGVIYFGGAILDFANHFDQYWKKKTKVLSKCSNLPVVYFVKNSYGEFNDPSCWFIPTKLCLIDWLKATGFTKIKIQVIKKTSRAFGCAIKDVNFKDFEHGKM